MLTPLPTRARGRRTLSRTELVTLVRAQCVAVRAVGERVPLPARDERAVHEERRPPRDRERDRERDPEERVARGPRPARRATGGARRCRRSPSSRSRACRRRARSRARRRAPFPPGAAGSGSAGSRRRTASAIASAIEAAFPQPHQVASTIPSTSPIPQPREAVVRRDAGRERCFDAHPRRALRPPAHDVRGRGPRRAPHPPRRLGRLRHPLEPRARAGDRAPGQGLLGVRRARHRLRPARRRRASTSSTGSTTGRS